MSKKKIRVNVYNKCNGHCAYCGVVISIGEMCIDHVEPIGRIRQFNLEKRKLVFTGKVLKPENDHIDNMLPSCHSCNSYKSSFNLEKFRTELLQQQRRLNEHSCNYRIAKRFGLIKENPNHIHFYFEKDKQNESR
jgi:hypothetical protein